MYSSGDALPRNPITGIADCAREERPRYRATEKCDELAPLHAPPEKRL